MKRKPILRTNDGRIINICIECGMIRYSRQKRLRPRCKSCGIKKSFQSRPAVGLKTIDNMDQVIKEYESGHTLFSLADKYGVAAMTIRAKILANGGKTKSYSQAAIQREKQHGTVSKAHAKVREMCKTGEFQKNRSAMLQGISIKQWKGFITPENQQLYKTPEYLYWQKSVFRRDKNTCRLCDKTKCPIAAHHIYMKAKYPDKVFDVNNGITLCNKCHHKTIGHEDSYVNHFVALLLGDLCGKKQ
jgi:hypothetical protein